MPHRRHETWAWAAILVATAVALSSACFPRGGRAASPAPAAQPPTEGQWAEPGPCSVTTLAFDWVDPRRNRPVGVKVYLPGARPEEAKARPVLIFSHGLGGSREGYAYLGRHWASWGYVSVHLQHEGSDDAVWRNQEKPYRAMSRAATDPRNALERPRDVRFALDRLGELNERDPVWQGRLDLARVGIAGHSFGAWTVLAAAGQAFRGPLGGDRSLGDPRIKAAVAMSAPVQADRRDRGYDAIRIPVFHLTGTRDDSPIGNTQAADRRVPYDEITHADQYLLTFTGGDHMVFSGRLGTSRPGDAAMQRWVLASTTAFWAAYLEGDPAAKAWLRGPLAGALGSLGRWEWKPGRP